MPLTTRLHCIFAYLVKFLIEIGLILGDGRPSKMKKITFLFCALLLLTLKLKVEHMACQSCAEKFKEQLHSVCKEVTLDFQNDLVLCKYDAPATPERILSEAKKSGFSTKIVP